MHVLITGASRGIGKAIAEKFAAHGHHLILSSHQEMNLYKTVEEFQEKFPGLSIKARSFNLTQKNQAKELAAWCQSLKTPEGEFIVPDVLINNAGGFQPGSIYNEVDGVLENQLALNLQSAYHLTRSLLPPMMERRRGHIFNLCSIAALKAYPNGGSYSISKYAMHGFSKNLREELKPFHIKVTTVFPGAVLTDSWGDFDNSGHRIMVAEDIAKMIFAASQLSPGACVEEIIIRPQLGDL
jgi:short-subunit dehydrogenase